MADEETIKQELEGKFEHLAPSLTIKRARRIFAETAYEKFPAVFDYLVVKMGFSSLCTITGQDEGENLSFIYHLARPDGTLLNLKTFVPKASPKLNSVVNYFPSAVIYEREAVDLLGAEVEGLPEDANRYPLPDNWPKGVYPLRKDFDPALLDQPDKCKGE